ncbi:hypothetical protein [Marinobacter sp. ELB17]|uniref:hypothetical protein n=1 Tax=Marinobacter sp. ELB17 TaxID=270374 RepID=UPI0000F37078|nr:hypothetical protein [Marinobacter sp. ELB17]EAZ97917.1 hypothetical protein MELB17_13632 [Marinobacter sp. ELB17]
MKPNELKARYTNHPLGWALQQLEQAPASETGQASFVMALTISELLCWQGELTEAERDCFHKEATTLAVRDQVKH